uniref:BHLH domain-containing protein n=1 Tax=Trichobilharzia regenti TaxID=157069 RepID=A0AA85KBB4_TRIRE|nr:unnamed protein product [Trichobilharzia regenti]
MDMVENLPSDFSRDSDGGSDRDLFEVTSSRLSACKHESSGDQQDKERYARESHCEIERRRRNKMTAYINELCEMVPTCSSLARKPDKLTILRMAVSHMKSIRGTGNTASDGSYKPSFLSDQELKHLVLEAADGFLFVCQCDTGRIIYVSDSVTAVLNQTQSEWYQHTLYELCHPDDVEKICEQLTGSPLPSQGASVLGLTGQTPTALSNTTTNNSNSINLNKPPTSSSDSKLCSNTSDSSPASVSDLVSSHLCSSQRRNSPTHLTNTICSSPAPGRILDLKTGTVKKEGHQSQLRGTMGSRRGFICRMRIGTAVPFGGMQSDVGVTNSLGLTARARLRYRHTFGALSSSNSQCSYAVVHVTGFVKPYNPVIDSSSNNIQSSGQPTGSQVYPLFDGLISEENEFNPQMSDNLHNRSDNNNNNTTNNKCPDIQVPQCLIALGRLQLVNKPEAVDLYPHRCNEFLTRHSVDTRITFCDQRIQNVLGLETNEVLGKAFGNFLPSSTDKISFQEVFDKAWKFKGQTFTTMVHIRSKLTNELLSVRCHLFAFVNPYSEEVEYIVCTTTSIKAFECNTSDPNSASTYAENNTSYSQSKTDFLDRTSHTTQLNCAIVQDHMNTATGNQLIQGNTESVPPPPYVGHPVNQTKDSHLSYWRSTNESTDHFDPTFTMQSGHNEVNISCNLNQLSFQSFPTHADSSLNSLNEPNSLHNLPCSNVRLIPQSNQEHTSIHHHQQQPHPNSVTGDYLSTLPSDYATLRTSTEFNSNDVSSAHHNNFDHKRNNNSNCSITSLDVPCPYQAYTGNQKSKNPQNSITSPLSSNECIIQTSESGLTRPSAICYMPSDNTSLGDCGCDLPDDNTVSPHTLSSYLNVNNRSFDNNNNHDTYLPSIDITSDESSTYRQALNNNHSITTSAFHTGWYDNSNLPSSSISTSESSSIPSDIYQHQQPQHHHPHCHPHHPAVVMNNHHHIHDDLTSSSSTSDFVYPPSLTQQLFQTDNGATTTTITSTSNNCMQQNQLQLPCYDYFKYAVQ